MVRENWFNSRKMLQDFDIDKDKLNEVAQYIRTRFLPHKKKTSDFLKTFIDNLTGANIMIFHFTRQREMKDMRGCAIYL